MVPFVFKFNILFICSKLKRRLVINKNKNPKYYYIFGVRIENTNFKDRGKLSLDFMIDYNSDDIENADLAKDMVDNEMIPTSSNEAIKAVGLIHLASTIYGSQFTARANNLSVHKMNTNFKITREDLHIWVDCCNHDEISLKKLEESKIHY